MKNKRIIYALILSLVVVSGIVFANNAIKKENPAKPVSTDNAKTRREAREKWEASPDGINYRKWETSPQGKKVQASVDNIRKNIETFSNMEGVVTSLSIPTNGGPVGLRGVVVKINGEDYILNYEPEHVNPILEWFKSEESNNLKVNDKIIIKSRYIARAPKYPYLIIMSDSIELNGKTIFKRELKKGDHC